MSVSFSTFANAYGEHNFKFGLEIERSGVRSQFDYMKGVYYYDYGGRRDYPRVSYYYPYPRYR